VPFEMVTIAAPGLEGTAADPTPFARHLASCAGLATATFANLGGDAQLVAPCASDGVPMDTYASIAPFVRGAPTSQLEQFWVAVGHAIDTTLNARGERCAELLSHRPALAHHATAPPAYPWSLSRPCLRVPSWPPQSDLGQYGGLGRRLAARAPRQHAQVLPLRSLSTISAGSVCEACVSRHVEPSTFPQYVNVGAFPCLERRCVRLMSLMSADCAVAIERCGDRCPLRCFVGFTDIGRMRRAGFSHFAEAGARPLGGEGRARSYVLARSFCPCGEREQLAVRDSGDRNQPMRDF
jgi:hypothetical protein